MPPCALTILAGMEQAKPHLPTVIYCRNIYDAAEGADAVVIATEWEQFRALDLGRLKSLMARPVMVDLRNIYRADEVRAGRVPLRRGRAAGFRMERDEFGRSRTCYRKRRRGRELVNAQP